jgi:hypothetical protein
VIVGSTLDVDALHRGLLVTGGLLIAGGVVSLVGIRNPAADTVPASATADDAVSD